MRRFVPEFTIVAVRVSSGGSRRQHGQRDVHLPVLRQEAGDHREHGVCREIKKAVFTILNYLLPLQGVLSMHCSANVSPEDPMTWPCSSA